MKLGRRARLVGTGTRPSSTGGPLARGVVLALLASLSSSAASLGQELREHRPAHALYPHTRSQRRLRAGANRPRVDGRQEDVGTVLVRWGKRWVGRQVAGGLRARLRRPDGDRLHRDRNGAEHQGGDRASAQGFVYAAGDDGRFTYLGDAVAAGTTEASLAADGIRTIRFSFEPVRTPRHSDHLLSQRPVPVP